MAADCMHCHLSAGIGAAQISIHRQCIGVHRLYDIRSLLNPSTWLVRGEGGGVVTEV